MNIDMNTIGIVIFLVAWFVLQRWVLPKFGVKT